ALGGVLADHVVIEERLDLGGLRKLLFARTGGCRGRVPAGFLSDDVVTKLDALVANVDRRAGDELFDFALVLSAERAAQISESVAELLIHSLPRSSRSHRGSRPRCR